MIPQHVKLVSTTRSPNVIGDIFGLRRGLNEVSALPWMLRGVCWCLGAMCKILKNSAEVSFGSSSTLYFISQVDL
jgi:hypothetical protein